MRRETCPNSDQLLDYLAGRLEKPEKEEFAKHISSCEHCQNKVSELLKDILEKSRGTSRPSEPPGECLSVDEMIDYVNNPRKYSKEETWKIERHIYRCHRCKHMRALAYTKRPKDIRARFHQTVDSIIITLEEAYDKLKSLISEEEVKESVTSAPRRLAFGTAGHAALPVIFLTTLAYIVTFGIFHLVMVYSRVESKVALAVGTLLCLPVGLIWKGREILNFLVDFLKQKEAERMNAAMVLLYITLIIVLNAPLLETVYTGLDMYGFFNLKFSAKEPASIVTARAIAINMTINAVIALLGVLAFHLIYSLFKKKYKEDDRLPIISSSFAIVLIPLAVVFLLIFVFCGRDRHVFILETYLPISAAFLAIVGYSHPKNKVSPFVSKLLLSISIGCIVIGTIFSIFILKWHLSGEIPHKVPSVWKSNIIEIELNQEQMPFDYDKQEFIEEWRKGFTWECVSVIIYLAVFLGFFTMLTIYEYQHTPAIIDEECRKLLFKIVQAGKYEPPKDISDSEKGYLSNLVKLNLVRKDEEEEVYYPR